MTAAEIAKKLKQDREEANRREEEANAKLTKHRERRRNEMAEWIKEALGSFGSPFNVQAGRFNGSDYWQLRQGFKVLVTCVLRFVTGTHDPSDDCRGVEFAEWQIEVYRGDWGGPASRSNQCEGTTTAKDDLNNYVARVMEKFI